MSSSYDSALIDTAMVDDPRQLMVPRGVRLLYLEALVWAKVRRTDGFIPTGALAKLTDEPEPMKGVEQLVTVGLWEAKPLGWQIADFADTQMIAARVRAIKAAARERYDRWRTKERQKAAQRVENATTNGPARPALPARAGGGQVGGGMAARLGEPATDAADGESTDTVACNDHSRHQAYHRPTGRGLVCGVCQRRDLGRIVREAPNEPMRHRYRKMFDREFGRFYGKHAT